MNKTSQAIICGGVLLLVFPAGATEIAKVDGQAITDRDVKTALVGMNEGQRESLLKDPSSRRQVLSSLIDQQVLAEEATREKLEQDPDFKEAMSAFKKQYLASQLLTKSVGPKLNVAAAKKFYEAHKFKYNTDEVHALHILLPDEAQAREVLRKAKAPDADFEALAEKLSHDPSARNNRGDLGFFSRDRMVPEFSDAAFGAKEGEIIGPIKTSFGYHVIKILQKKVGKTLSYDDVELRVKNDLRQELATNYVGKLRQKAKIEIDEKALDKLQGPSNSPGH